MDKPKLLIVEDSPQNIDILRIALAEEYDLRIATNGKQAFDVISATGLPDLVLMDIMMPEMDGFEATRRFKMNPSLRDIPVIFLTAKQEEEDIVKGFSIGAADYVQKPFRIPELKARISTHLDLKDSRQIIETRNQELREILHILCHDLANPFNNIQSVLSILEDDEEAIKATLPDLSRASRHGIEIINLVRELRSLEEKGLEVGIIDLSDAWMDASEALRHRFQDKGVRLEPEEFDEPWLVRGERVSLIHSILSNLLTNALKFSAEGTTVRAGISKTGNKVQFTLSDEGIGIPETMVGRVFDPAARDTQRKGTNGESGTGFGLPIVRKIMELYGGSVDIDSVEGQGTTFILTFIS